MQDKLLSEAMVPTVEEFIQISVKKDLTVLSDIIFPVIGPASRKAIATALEAAVQSLNQSIEHSLSPCRP
jgi:OOP family OmpA-OmpF porin